MNILSLPHQESKERYLRYREIARELFEENDDIKIPQHATVQVVEEGAFVEAMVWVPKDKL